MALLAQVHYLPAHLYLLRVHNHGQNLTRSPKASYKKIRDKWDFYISDKEEVNNKIEKAIRYYYLAHAPLRHLKVSAMAAKEYLNNWEVHTLKWSIKCLNNFLVDFVFKKAFRERMKERNVRISAQGSLKSN